MLDPSLRPSLGLSPDCRFARDKSFSRSLLSLAMLAVVASLALFLPASGQARAEEFVIGEDPISAIARWRPSIDPPEMAPFVQKTRPPEELLDYQPLTAPAPKRLKLKTPQQFDASIRRLDRAAAKNKIAAAREFRLQSSLAKAHNANAKNRK